MFRNIVQLTATQVDCASFECAVYDSSVRKTGGNRDRNRISSMRGVLMPTLDSSTAATCAKLISNGLKWSWSCAQFGEVLEKEGLS
jgi:hypothetical protein